MSGAYGLDEEASVREQSRQREGEVAGWQTAEARDNIRPLAVDHAFLFLKYMTLV